MTQQQLSVITLGIADPARSRRFYCDGFGWTPVFENDEIAFYQMNGFVLGTWLTPRLEADMQRPGLTRPGAFALAHNVAAQAQVQPLIDHLVAAGGTLLRTGDAPDHGGFRGYVADPDDHAWEIAWNPAWTISPEGLVTFAV
ncbi:VOC family protein [Sphingomonas rustica]